MYATHDHDGVRVHADGDSQHDHNDYERDVFFTVYIYPSTIDTLYKIQRVESKVKVKVTDMKSDWFSSQ